MNEREKDWLAKIKTTEQKAPQENIQNHKFF